MRTFANASMTRRRIIGTALMAGACASVCRTRRASSEASGPFSLPPLPYPDDALAPVISPTTIGFHYGKHHKAYVDNLNKAIEGTELANKSLEDIVKAVAADPSRVAIFNNAAQDWNHTFYWSSMRPNGGGMPSGAIADRIKDSFGDYRQVSPGICQCRGDPVRQRLGLARAGPRQEAESGEDGECRYADDASHELRADLRRLGTCLLPRLPESPPRLCERLARQARELGFCLPTARGMNK